VNQQCRGLSPLIIKHLDRRPIRQSQHISRMMGLGYIEANLADLKLFDVNSSHWRNQLLA